MSRMSIKHTGTVPNSSKGNDVRATSYETYLWELDMICLMAGSPDPGSFSLILALSPLYLPTVINGSIVELVTTQRKNREMASTLFHYFIYLHATRRRMGADLLSVAGKEELLRRFF